MDQRQFVKWMDSDDKLPASSVDALRQIIAEFPYFQTAHALLAKAMADQHDLLYDKHLKIAAAYSNDRRSLYHLIHKKPSPLFTPEESPVSSSPFVLTKEKEQPPVVATELPESPQETFAPPLPEPEPIHFSAPPVTDEKPVTKEEEITDPHEIIRRRLAEILGTTATIDKKEVTTRSTPPEVKTEIPVTDPVVIESIKAEEPSDTPTHVEYKIPAASDLTTQQVENPPQEIADEITSIESVPESAEIDTTANDPEERIVVASAAAIDDVDKLQLEYALETSILSSIEHLPVIEKSAPPAQADIKVEDGSDPFIHWLHQRTVSGFGQIEEVHADDPAEIVDSTPPPSADKRPEDELIERFIATEPRIVPSKTEFYSPVSQAKKSITEHEDLVSETLAKIYLLQGHPLKARKCYEKLSLLQPEKKTYFAALINEIDQKINNSENQDL